jgi:hypothetical protein
MVRGGQPASAAEAGIGLSFRVLPLAVTMMAGPQIIAAVIFVTAGRAVRLSLAFLAGVLIATSLGVAVATGIGALLSGGAELADSDGPSTAANVIEVVLVGLLLAAAVHSYLGRQTAAAPQWMEALLDADPKTAFKSGLLLILLFPSDVVVLLTVGVQLQYADPAIGVALAFIAATVLIAALPLLTYLLFGQRAARTMPKVRDWMNTHSWAVNIFVYAVFITLILSGG